MLIIYLDKWIIIVSKLLNFFDLFEVVGAQAGIFFLFIIIIIIISLDSFDKIFL